MSLENPANLSGGLTEDILSGRCNYLDHENKERDLGSRMGDDEDKRRSRLWSLLNLNLGASAALPHHSQNFKCPPTTSDCDDEEGGHCDPALTLQGLPGL